VSSDVRKPCQEMDFPGWGCQWNLEGVLLDGRGWDFPRDNVAEKGRAGFIFFWSVEFPYGMRCTLAVSSGIMRHEQLTERTSDTRL